MLKLKLQYFGHLMQRVDSLEDSDAGRDWGQEEKGTTEDEMAGWYHRLDGYEFEWTPGVSDGQGVLACCNSWGHRESDRSERLNWTDWTVKLRDRIRVRQQGTRPSPRRVTTLYHHLVIGRHGDFLSSGLEEKKERRWSGPPKLYIHSGENTSSSLPSGTSPTDRAGHNGWFSQSLWRTMGVTPECIMKRARAELLQEARLGIPWLGELVLVWT